MSLDPKIWGPHYWFVLHTITLTYPINPNETIKKKYYDLIQNLPLFIPIENIGNYFSEAKLLNIAHIFQTNTNWHNLTPEEFK